MYYLVVEYCQISPMKRIWQPYGFNFDGVFGGKIIKWFGELASSFSQTHCGI
jgi:hypothetical protein